MSLPLEEGGFGIRLETVFIPAMQIGVPVNRMVLTPGLSIAWTLTTEVHSGIMPGAQPSLQRFAKNILRRIA